MSLLQQAKFGPDQSIQVGDGESLNNCIFFAPYEVWYLCIIVRLGISDVTISQIEIEIRIINLGKSDKIDITIFWSK